MSSRPTLPGTIPGLLRRCSPVLITEDSGAGTRVLQAGQRGVVLMLQHPDFIGPTIALEGWRTFPIPCDRLLLDLSDRTGALHAAWWLEQQPITLTNGADCDALDRALAGKTLSEDEVQRLRKACRRVATQAKNEIA